MTRMQSGPPNPGRPPAKTTSEASRSLAGVGIFAGITPPERAALEKRCRWQSFAAGAEIIDRENDSREVYFVVAGAVRVVNYSLSGREVSFAEIRAGGCFGELAALDGQPRSANVVAIEDTLTACLSGSVFLDMLAHHPTASIEMLRRLAAVVRQATGRIMDLSTMGAHNRIYAELLREAVPTGGNRAKLQPIPVHADLAARVSTTRETVARALGDLARKGIARREGDALIILDIARLADMVQHFQNE